MIGQQLVLAAPPSFYNLYRPAFVSCHASTHGLKGHAESALHRTTRTTRRGSRALAMQGRADNSGQGSKLFALALVGASLGPSCDALHNQVLLAYDVLPVEAGAFGAVAKTSLLIPPLLALTYCLLGGVFPPLVEKVVGTGQIPAASWTAPLSVRLRAAMAVASTAAIIRSSCVLASANVSNPVALGALSLMALVQWAVIDGAYSSLALALILAIGVQPSSKSSYSSSGKPILCKSAARGPIAEIPFMAVGCWHYLTPV